MPNLPVYKDRPKTRAATSQSLKKTTPEVQKIIQEASDSDSYSDFDYYRPPRPNHTRSKNLDQKTQDTAGPSVVLQEEESASLQSEESPEEDSELLDGGDQDLRPDSDPEAAVGPEQEDLRQDEDQNTIAARSTIEIESDSVSESRLNRKPETRPKRSVKPVVRLTYDEPGKASNQPITIIHRGMVIKIGKGQIASYTQPHFPLVVLNS